MGEPNRIAINRSSLYESGLNDKLPGCHPVFALAEHFTGRDNYEGAGYTKNPYRGDHQSVPVWSEFDPPFVLETSFHKGLTYVEVVTFPDAHPAVVAAAQALLGGTETR